MKLMALLFLTMIAYSEQAFAKCPKYSWITALHSELRGIGCQSAQKEIDNVFSTITYALKSGRSVEIQKFGQLSVKIPKRKKTQNESRARKIVLKVAKELNDSINPSQPEAKS